MDEHEHGPGVGCWCASSATETSCGYLCRGMRVNSTACCGCGVCFSTSQNRYVNVAGYNQKLLLNRYAVIEA